MQNQPSQSYWLETTTPNFPKASQAARYDVVVVGGGIAGLTAALLLKRAGKSVCVLESERIAFGDTGHTTAHLTVIPDAGLKELTKVFGSEHAKLVWQAGAVAIDTIEGLVKKHRIECDFMRLDNYVHVPLDGTDEDLKIVQGEADTARDLGIESEFIERTPLFGRAAVRFPDQALFHPVKYLAALARLIDGDGCAVYEQSKAEKFETDPARVIVNDVEIGYDDLIIMTHIPLMGEDGLVDAMALQTKLYKYSTYAIAGTHPDQDLPQASFYDTDDPYKYLRLNVMDGEVRVIYGGEDHKTGQADDIEERYARLREELLKILPETKLNLRWTGQVIETNDGLPYIGESTEHQFAATGFSGNGMTFGTIAGLMARDWVMQKENPWEDLFSLGRKKLRGGTWEYLKENIDYPYYMAADWLKTSRKDDPATLAIGEGAIFKVDGRQAACARDHEGVLHQVSAICPHMGCIVHWNGTESTWDCPCHGSRFACDGKLMAGPAETDLENI